MLRKEIASGNRVDAHIIFFSFSYRSLKDENELLRLHVDSPYPFSFILIIDFAFHSYFPLCKFMYIYTCIFEKIEDVLTKRYENVYQIKFFLNSRKSCNFLLSLTYHLTC